MECPRLVIRKALRILEVYAGDTLAMRMPVALGREPAGRKEREGDGRTPEGSYTVCVRNDKSKYHLALGLSYPNLDDAEKGLRAGIINQSEYDSIISAVRCGKRPPWNTGLGGEIMIHGGGTTSDWTAGCIALDDGSMDTLWNVAETGTVVQILP